MTNPTPPPTTLEELIDELLKDTPFEEHIKRWARVALENVALNTMVAMREGKSYKDWFGTPPTPSGEKRRKNG